MARTIAPGNPTAIQPANVNIPDIDLSLFDKLGDDKIKSATQNFKLYATTTIQGESQKLYNKYQNNPLALANALEKLPETLNELPESVRAEFLPKIQSTAFTLVQKAAANQEKAIEKQNKLMAAGMADGLEIQIGDSFFNRLRYFDAPEEDKRKLDLDIDIANREQLKKLTTITDADGNPIFSDSQRAKMFMPKDAIMRGAKSYINRMEPDQLKAWYNKFLDRSKFMQDMDVDDDIYDSIEQYVDKRINWLEDDKIAQRHGQAYYDQVNLIDEPTQLNIEKAKSYEWVDDKLIDNAVKSAKEITQAKYYDPTRRTAPDAFIGSLNLLGDAVKNNDWSIEGREQAVAQMFQTLGKLEDFAKQTNMSPEQTNAMATMIKKAVTDPEANKALVDSGILNIRDFSNPLVAGMKYGTDIIKQTGESNDDYIIVEPEFGDITIQDVMHPTNRPIAKIMSQRSQLKGAMAAKATANENFSRNIERAYPYYVTGDYQNFALATKNAWDQRAMDAASYIVKNGYEWERLLREYKEGKKPLYNYMGRMLEFKGIQNGVAVFDETF